MAEWSCNYHDQRSNRWERSRWWDGWDQHRSRGFNPTVEWGLDDRTRDWLSHGWYSDNRSRGWDASNWSGCRPQETSQLTTLSEYPWTTQGTDAHSGRTNVLQPAGFYLHARIAEPYSADRAVGWSKEPADEADDVWGAWSAQQQNGGDAVSAGAQQEPIAGAQLGIQRDAQPQSSGQAGSGSDTTARTLYLRQPAVAARELAVAARGLEIFDITYFRSYKPEATIDWTDGYRQHNVALKWLRQEGERTRTDRMFLMAPNLIPEINHPKGMSFSFNTDSNKTNWKWQEMVAQLDDVTKLEPWGKTSLQLVVEGTAVAKPSDQGAVVAAPSDRSRGLVYCILKQKPRYDHQMECMARQNNPTARDAQAICKVWDFVLTRADGPLVSLHPNYAKTEVKCYFGEAPEDYELPRTGAGGTSGRGTYKAFKYKNIDVMLKFDATKRPEPRTAATKKPARSQRPKPQSRSPWAQAAVAVASPALVDV